MKISSLMLSVALGNIYRWLADIKIQKKNFAVVGLLSHYFEYKEPEATLWCQEPVKLRIF